MSDKPVILAIDRNRRNAQLVAELLIRQGYVAEIATSLEEFDRLLESPGRIALALVDVAGFDGQIWQRCQRLRDAQVPFLVLSRAHTALMQQQSLAAGARGVLTKPLGYQELLGAVRGLLEESGCGGCCS